MDVVKQVLEIVERFSPKLIDSFGVDFFYAHGFSLCYIYMYLFFCNVPFLQINITLEKNRA